MLRQDGAAVLGADPHPARHPHPGGSEAATAGAEAGPALAPPHLLLHQARPAAAVAAAVGAAAVVIVTAAEAGAGAAAGTEVHDRSKIPAARGPAEAAVEANGRCVMNLSFCAVIIDA